MVKRTGIGAKARSAALVALACLVFQAMAQDRYNGISQRNAFGLKPAPVPVPPPPPKPPAPPVTVKLTGIINYLSTKKAILLITEQGKPSESKVMAENQMESQVEIKQIDPLAGVVLAIVSGQEVSLDFNKDGVKPPAGGRSASDLFASAANGNLAPSVNSGRENLASYLSRVSTAASTAPNGPAHANNGAMMPLGGGISSPFGGMPFRLDPSAAAIPTRPNWPPEVPVTPEESLIHMEIQRQLQQNSNRPMPPLPPTILSPDNGQQMPPGPF
jgi:hypothetical protein